MLSGFLAAEVVLIATAIYNWVKYFKIYVGFQIEHRLGYSDKSS